MIFIDLSFFFSGLKLSQRSKIKSYLNTIFGLKFSQYHGPYSQYLDRNCPDTPTEKISKIVNIHNFQDDIDPMPPIQKLAKQIVIMPPIETKSKTYKTNCLDAANSKNIKANCLDATNSKNVKKVTK